MLSELIPYSKKDKDYIVRQGKDGPEVVLLDKSDWTLDGIDQTPRRHASGN